MGLARKVGGALVPVLSRRRVGGAVVPTTRYRKINGVLVPTSFSTVGPTPSFAAGGVSGTAASGSNLTLDPEVPAGTLLVLFLESNNASITWTAAGYTSHLSNTSGNSSAVLSRRATGDAEDTAVVVPNVASGVNGVIVPIVDASSLTVGARMRVTAVTSVTISAAPNVDSANQLSLTLLATNVLANTWTYDPATTSRVDYAGTHRLMALTEDRPAAGAIPSRTHTMSPTAGMIMAYPIVVRPILS